MSVAAQGTIASGSFRSMLSSWLPLAGVAVLPLIAVGLRFYYPMNADTSWLLTVGEKFLAGEKLYVDVIEVNPPASVYLYLPAIVLARLLPLSAEFFVNLLVLASIAGSLLLSARILSASPAGRMALNWPVLLAAVFVLGVMPGETFTEREHIATIAALPWLSALLVRMDGNKPVMFHALVAGICGGLLFCIKPVFAVPIAMAVAASLYVRRDWRIVTDIENLAAGTISVVYVASVYIFQPEFFSQIMPLLQATYLAYKNYGRVLGDPLFPYWAVLILAAFWFRGRRILREPAGLLLIASAGFTAMCIWQGKFWDYHYYPLMATGILGGICVAHSMHADRQKHADEKPPIVRTEVLIFALVLACIARAWQAFGPHEDMNKLADAINRIANKPSIAVLSDDIAIGHPLTRQIGARWVGSFCAQWVPAYEIMLGRNGKIDDSNRTTIAGYVRLSNSTLARDIASKKPDIILAAHGKFDWLAWALADKAIAAQLRSYRKVDEVLLNKRGTYISILKRSVMTVQAPR